VTHTVTPEHDIITETTDTAAERRHKELMAQLENMTAILLRIDKWASNISDDLSDLVDHELNG